MKRTEEEEYLDELSRVNNELVNLQRELAKRNAELENLNQLKNQFLAMVSHDLRKPVGAVISYSEFLSDEIGDQVSEEHRSFLEVVNRSAWRMRQMIDDFLDVSLIESGRFELNYAPVALATLIQRAMEILEPAAKRHDVFVTVDIGAHLPDLSVDAPKMEQVFLNLIGNCIEHGGPGTQVHVGALATHGTIQAHVEDDGPGIPREQLASLFVLSGALRPSRRRKSTGERSTGLGLVVAKKIVDAHGGALRMASTVGEGTTAVVELPLGAGSHAGH